MQKTEGGCQMWIISGHFQASRSPTTNQPTLVMEASNNEVSSEREHTASSTPHKALRQGSENSFLCFKRGDPSKYSPSRYPKTRQHRVSITGLMEEIQRYLDQIQGSFKRVSIAFVKDKGGRNYRDVKNRFTGAKSPMKNEDGSSGDEAKSVTSSTGSHSTDSCVTTAFWRDFSFYFLSISPSSGLF